MEAADRLAQAMDALRAGRWVDAEADLAVVRAALTAAQDPELRDISARVCSLHAQALHALGRLADADRACRDALRLLRALGDRAGMDQVRSLQDVIVRGLAHDAEARQRQVEQTRIASTPLAELLVDATTPLARAEVLTKKATALTDTGDPDAARPLAVEAVALASAGGDVTWEVMARIALARVSPPDVAAAELAAALHAADAANEFNLVATLARAAEVIGVPLPTHPGPHGAPDRQDP